MARSKNTQNPSQQIPVGTTVKYIHNAGQADRGVVIEYDPGKVNYTIETKSGVRLRVHEKDVRIAKSTQSMVPQFEKGRIF